MTIKQYDLHTDIQEGGDQTLCNIEIVLIIAANGHDETCCRLSYQGRKYRMLRLCLSIDGTNLYCAMNDDSFVALRSINLQNVIATILC